MLSDDIKCMADQMAGYAQTGVSIAPQDVRRLMTTLYAMQLVAERLEATKATQAVTDAVARIVAEQRELRG
jgi:hypothetical protein